jgi:hypothetical protein
VAAAGIIAQRATSQYHASDPPPQQRNAQQQHAGRVVTPETDTSCVWRARSPSTAGTEAVLAFRGLQLADPTKGPAGAPRQMAFVGDPARGSAAA